MSLNDKENHLNSNSFKDEETLLHVNTRTVNEVPKNWDYLRTNESEKVVKKNNWGKIALICGIIIFSFSIIYAAYAIYYKANQLDESKIAFSVDAPDSIEPGKDFDIKIITSNGNKIPISNIIINFQYDKSLSGSGVINAYKKSYNYSNLEYGNTKIENIENIKLYGRNDDMVKLKAHLSYQIQGNNGTFVKDVYKEIKLLPRQISIKIEGPKDIDAGEAFNYKVIVRNDSDRDIGKARMTFAFPAEYITLTASSTLNEKNEWEIFNFNKGGEYSNTIVATQGGINGERKAVRVKLEEVVDDIPAIINDATYDYNIIYLPLMLTAKLKVNHSNTNYIYNGQKGTLNLLWENNLNESIANLYFVLSYNGTSTIINKDNFPDLVEISAGNKSSIELPLIGQPDIDGNMRISIVAYGDRLQSSITNNKLGSTDISIKVRN